MSFVFQEGLLSSLTNLKSITVPRNAFQSYPTGGPSQFCSVEVSGQLHVIFFFYNQNIHCGIQKKQNHILFALVMCWLKV